MNLASTLFCARCSCSADTGTSQYVFASGGLYNGFRSTRKYHGSTESASLKFVSISKNNTWKEVLCLRMCLLRTSANQPDSTCARLSGTFSLKNNFICTLLLAYSENAFIIIYIYIYIYIFRWKNF